MIKKLRHPFVIFKRIIIIIKYNIITMLLINILRVLCSGLICNKQSVTEK